MPELQLLHRDHAAELLAFELDNRAYFTKSVPDRGDDYFENFDERHGALLAEQIAGTCYFHVIVANNKIVGRINLLDVAGGEAELGFRVAEQAVGKGLATAAVNDMFVLAVKEYGLVRLRASAAVDNVGSRSVLTRTGFVPTGETTLAGKPGVTYVRDLT